MYDRPLDRGDILQIHLDAEIAACDHNAVGGLDDLIDIIDALLILDLGDDLDVTLAAVEDLLYLIHVLARADKGVSDEVHIVIHGEEDGVPVPLGDGGEVDADVGDVDALM